MVKKLRVLLVEDSEDDCELIKISLAKGGYEVASERVDNAKTMAAALDRDKYDIVLSDHQMPSFDSREALLLLRKHDDELPLILVSGKIGEKGAVELMKAGASDYVSKNHLALLSVAVERALDEHEDTVKRKQAEEDLHNSEQRYRTIVENINDALHIVDLKGNILDVNENACRQLGYTHKEMIGKNLKDIDIGGSKNIVQEKLKHIEKENSVVFESLEVKKDGSLLPVEVSAKLISSEGNGLVQAFVRDITHRKAAEEEQSKSYEKLKATLEGTVNALSAVSEHRDPYTAGHQERVAKIACAIAKEMGLSSERCEDIRIAGKLHDIGKIEVPAEILSKPGKLTNVEFSMIKVHSTAGYNILKEAELPCGVAETVLEHHERLDGSGYPQGLTTGEISIAARIMAVADVVEAMSSHRPYRAAFGVDKALEEIEKNRGKLYDPDVVDACVKLFREKGFEF